MALSMEDLIKGLICADNKVRDECEKLYEESLINNTDLIISSLSSNLGNQDTCVIASVLLRRAINRNIGKQPLWMKLSPETKSVCKNNILVNVQNSPKILDIISEIVRIDGDWPELMNVNSPKEVIFRVIADNPELCSKYQHIYDLLKANLKTPEAFKALCSILIFGEKAKRQYSTLFNEWILHYSSEMLEDESVLEDLIALAGECPKTFKTNACQLTQLCLSVMASNNLILELIVTLVEGLPSLFKKEVSLLGSIVHAILLQVSQIGDDESSWDEDEDEDEDSNQALQALDRLSMSLKDDMAPILFSQIPAMISDANFKIRYAALMSIAYGAEGCIGALETQIAPLLSLIWPAFRDTHPRVAFAACQVLGQLCTDFNGLIQRDYTKISLEHLVGLLSSSNHAKVQTHAAAALVNFSEGVDQDNLNPFLGDIVNRLISLLQQTQNNELQEQLLATIAAFATASKKAFLPHYQSLYTICMMVLTNPNCATRLLQCRAIEAITLLCSIIKEDPIGCEKLLPIMYELQNSIKSHDDPMKGYLCTAWQRMNGVMKEKMASYLSICLPPLIEEAKAEVEMALLDDSDDSEDYDPNEWMFTRSKTGKLGIKTSMLDAKSDALLALCEYAENPAFAQFAIDLYPFLVNEMVNYQLSDEVQASSMHLLCACYIFMGVKEQQEIITIFIEGLNSNPDKSVACLECLAQLLNKEMINNLNMQIITTKLEKCIQFIKKHLGKNKTNESEDEHDNDDNNEDDEDEDDSIEQLTYALGTFVQALCKQKILPPNCIIQFALDYANQNIHKFIQHASICMIIDLAALVNIPNLSTILDRGLKEKENLDILQASVYGVGVVASNPAMQSYCTDKLGSLLKMIIEHENRPSYRMIFDNIISAAAKIFTAYPQTMTEDLLHYWLRGLPVVTDEEEIIPVLSFIINNQSNIIKLIPTSNVILARALRAPPIEFVQSKDPQLVQLILRQQNTI